MKAACRTLSILMVFVASAPLARSQAVNSADAKYQALLERVKRGDATAGLAELRLAFASTSNFPSDPDSDLHKQMFSALDKKDYAAAKTAAERALEDYYVDIDVHQVLYIVYRETNEPEKSKFHHDIVKGLIDAIFDSGDGKSQDSAFKVISTREEYIVLQVLDLRPNKQSLQNGKGHQYDVLEAVDPTGEVKTLYFNIDMSMAALSRELKQK